jgi:hypothetical protein
VTRYLRATSREYLVVPAWLLAAVPLVDVVDLAVMPDDGTEPADAAWVTLTWVSDSSGVPLGAGILCGPSGHLPLPPGTYRMWLREHLPGDLLPVRAWERLTVGDP